MSAFMCSDEHVNRILDAARVADRHHDLIHHLGALPGDSLSQRLTSLGRMLHAENLKSMTYRYTLPAAERLDYKRMAAGYLFVQGGDQQRDTSAVEGLKLISSWRYQSCEHPVEQRDADTWDLLQRIERTLIGALPGYDDAPWTV